MSWLIAVVACEQGTQGKLPGFQLGFVYAGPKEQWYTTCWIHSFVAVGVDVKCDVGRRDVSDLS